MFSALPAKEIMKEVTMGAVYDALLEVSPERDKELLDGYRVYESALEGILTPKQLAAYAEYLRQSKAVRVFDEMTADQIAALPPEQIPIASAILANETSLMENRRVAALLYQRGQQDTAQDVDA
jgi:hypothetical protein